MPTLDFRYFLIVQTLDNGALLAEPLFFPKILHLDDDRQRAAKAVAARVRESLEQVPAGDVYRLRPAGVPRTAAIDIELPPPRRTPGWRSPAVLTFHYVHWDHGDEAHIAYVPALGIETITTGAARLPAKLAQDVRAALARSGAARSLERLTGLQRTRGIEVVESQVAVDVSSTLEDAEGDNRDQPESVLAKVATDLTRERLPPAFEMGRPLSELAEALTSGHRPGVLLVGASGTGKTALVHELVRRRGELHLAQTPFWSTSGSRIVAGMSGFGMWQQRCRDLAQEASRTGAVLHVDNLVESIGAGRHIGNRQGVAAFLRPHVERGDLRVIAECAPEQTAVVEREEPRLLAAFHRLDVPQPTPEQERTILRHAARAAAAAAGHGRNVVPAGAEAARAPTDAGHGRNVVPAGAEAARAAAAAGHGRNVVPAGAEDEPAAARRRRATLPDGRDKAAAARRRRGTPPEGKDVAPITDGAIETLAFLHRRFSTSSAHPGRPLRFLKNLIDGSGRSDVVGEAEVVAAFARETGLPRFLLDHDEALDLDAAHAFFTRRVMGQPQAVARVVDVLATVKAGLSRAGRPIGSLLLIGPTGVGKTETAKALAEFLYRSPARMIRIDMSEYADAAAVDRLIGGSLASEGLLTARIREQPFSVVLLDEFEKAHPAFFDLLLQVLGDGRLTDSAGRVASFDNAIIVMTSNLGVESFARAAPGFRAVEDTLRRSEQHFVAKVREHVRPELFNRIDSIVPFSPLDRPTIRAIARREIDEVRARDGIRHRRLDLHVDAAVVDVLADRGYEPRYGARPLKRAIQRRLVTPVAERANRYADDVAVTVRAEMVDGAIDVSARARREGGRDDAATRASPHDRLAAVDQVTAARRRIQLLDNAPCMQQLRNECYRLEQDLHRLQRRARRRGTESDAAGIGFDELRQLTSAVAALQRFPTAVAALLARAAQLEDDTLAAFYADRPLDAGAIRSSLAAMLDESERLAVDALLESSDAPETVALVVSGERSRLIGGLAAAYLAVVRARGGEGRVSELHRHPPPPGAALLSKFAKDPPVEWGTIAYTRPVPDPDAFLESPPEKLVAVAVTVHGKLLHRLLHEENGLHTTPDGRCRVDVVHGRDVDYAPPARLGRRDAAQGVEQRRTYETTRFADALRDAVERRLRAWIDSEIGTWS